jgi:hypothetical protein
MRLRTMKASSTTKNAQEDLVLQEFQNLFFLWPATMIAGFFYVVAAAIVSNVSPPLLL